MPCAAQQLGDDRVVDEQQLEQERVDLRMPEIADGIAVDAEPDGDGMAVAQILDV